MKADEIVYEAQAEEAEELEPDATVDPDQDHTNGNGDGNGNGDEANEAEGGKPIDADDELGIQHPDEEEEEDLVGEEEGEAKSEVKGEMNGADTEIAKGEDAEPRLEQMGGKEGEVEISPPKRARSVSVHLDEEEVVGKRVKMDGGESSIAVLREPS